MRQELLSFSQENTERHKNAMKIRNKGEEVIYTTRKRKLDTDTEYLIARLGAFRVTDTWAHTDPSSLRWASQFFKQEGFDSPLQFLQEITRIYGDADGNLPALYTHRLVRIGMGFEQVLPYIKERRKVRRLSWSPEYSLCISNGGLITKMDGIKTQCAVLSHTDVLAEDWVVCDEGGEE